MPLDTQLLQRAERNERLLGTFDISSTEFLDWAVVVSFYVALRYVDAFFTGVLPEYRPRDHGYRNSLIARTAQTKAIFSSYRLLFDQSVDARYELAEFSTTDVDALINVHMSSIKRHILLQA